MIEILVEAERRNSRAVAQWKLEPRDAMAESREDLVRQIRQCKLDRLTTDDPKLREKLRTLILRLEILLAQMVPL
jgi:hypothetical protein